MTTVLETRPNMFADSPLDRAAGLRDDPGWIAAQLGSPDTLWAPVWRSRSLVRGEGADARGVYLSGETAARMRASGAPWAFLGLLSGAAVFATDLSHADDPALPSGMSFADLRMARLPPDDAAVLAHARALMHWRTRHGFCGVCGGVCEPRSAGHALVCQSCGAQHFPRTDPAVIMLVHRGPRVLLGHSARFPNRRMYSTLAGFVEPGESLEEAVRREVAEETGVTLGAVTYHSSQPWPFPSSIMLGFTAEATSDAITLDPELLDARWLSRADIRDRAAQGFDVPPPLSIARRMIDDWMTLENSHALD